MNPIREIVVVTVACFVATTANAAQFGFVNEIDVVVAGDIDLPENTLLTTTYNGPSSIMTEFTLNGTLRSVIPETFGSEAHFVIANLTRGYAFFFDTNTHEDTFNTLNVSAPNGAAFLFVDDGDQFAFLAADDFDDGPGADAVWDTVSLTFSDDRPITHIGSFAPGLVSIDGTSAAVETGLGIYDANGNLLDEGVFDDDTPLDVQFDPGIYYMVVAGEGAIFGDSHAATTLFDEHVGADPFEITFNGNAVANGSLGGHGPNALFSFTVTPEPASAVLLAGAAFLLRRRRR